MVEGVGDPEEHDERGHGLEHAQREIEDRLQRTLPANDDESDEHSDESREDQLLGAAEEQADHQRQLVHRERVRVVADLDVHREAVGQREAEGEQRPRDAPVGHRGFLMHDGDEEEGGECRERGAEEDDLARRAHFARASGGAAASSDAAT